MYGVTAALGMVVGQILGGLLVSLDIAGVGWRSVFLINVPVGVAALLAIRRVPATRAGTRPGFDPLGTLLFGATMVCVLAVVVAGPDLDWPLWLWSLLVVAAAGLSALVRVERGLEARGGSPLLSPSVLSHPGTRRGLAAVVPFQAGFGAFLFVYALIAQGHFGFHGLASGGGLAPFAVAFFAVAQFTPKIVAALGGRIVTLGALVQGAGLVLLALVMGLGWPHPSLTLVLIGIALFGAGAALIGPTLFRMILADVPPAQAGMGSGVLVTSQQMATALGTTVGGTLFVSLDGPFLDGDGGRPRPRPADVLRGGRPRDQSEAPRPPLTSPSRTAPPEPDLLASNSALSFAAAARRAERASGPADQDSRGDRRRQRHRPRSRCPLRARAGLGVLMTDIDEAVHRRASELAAQGARVTAVTADLTDPHAVDRLADTAFDRLGGIDVVCNNAGVLGPVGGSRCGRCRWSGCGRSSRPTTGRTSWWPAPSSPGSWSAAARPI